MMKKYLIPALALAAASVAVPAMAQSYGPQGHDDRGGRYEQDRDGRYDQNQGGRYDHNQGSRYGNDRNSWQNISQRKYVMDRRIDQGERNRMLSRQEATRLRYDLNALVRLERTYASGGLSYRERADLDRRYNALAARIRFERRDNNGRAY